MACRPGANSKRGNGVGMCRVLLSNGDAWELEQCDCRVSDGISCGGQPSGKLLAGYENWRSGLRWPPVSPAPPCPIALPGSLISFERGHCEYVPISTQ